MIDPNNVMIRCPNGHELQAAKTDLDKPLACPVCSVTFTPSAVGAVSSAPHSMQPSAGAAGPTTMSCAPDSLTKPVNYPGYTNWMLGLWIVCVVLQALSSYYQIVKLTQIDPENPEMGALMMLLSLGCFLILGFVTAIVLQLMWVYRIHMDARLGRKYDAISPGLAMGLTFLVPFSFPWMAWTMKKLALFSAQGERDTPAVKACNVCLIMGILLALTFCVLFGMQIWIGLEAMREVQATGVQNIDQAKLQAELVKKIPLAWQVGFPAILVASVFVFAWAVRKLEATLYPFLGAPNR